MREFLQYVKKPGRYIGPEPNAIIKQHNTVKLKVALVYPDLYEIGISNLGLRIIYELINEIPYALAERAYSPGTDMEAILRKHNAKLTTIESDTPLDMFDVIGITLQTELNYVNAVNVLKLAGLPLRAKDRKGLYPIVIGGGSCTYNPEPVADFFDAFIIGDGEVVIKQIIDTIISCKETGAPKQECIERLASIKGVYAPALYKQTEDLHGNFKGIIPINSSVPQVTRAIFPDINKITLKHQIIPFVKPVHDRLVVEIARGCTKGCRFCQAGMIYRPVREKDVDIILNEIRNNIATSGFSDISLLSLSSADYTHIVPLLKAFMSEFRDNQCSISLPSLRVDSVTSQILAQIKQVRKTGFTIAIEAGTQRLRNVINKNITDEQIISSVELAAKMGWQTVKLYFMLGLPFETENDVIGMGEIIKRIHSAVRRYNSRTRINASISAFIPKPHTPFQWAEMISPETFNTKLSMVKNIIKNTGVVIKHQIPESSLIEAILARGDRRLGNVIEDLVKNGVKTDSSMMEFDYASWFNAIVKHGFSLQELLRARQYDEPLPWDHINTFLPKSFLWQEYEKARTETPTPDCFTEVCYNCGVCDFKSIEPVHAKNVSTVEQESSKYLEEPVWTTTVRIKYTKTGLIRFLGHLEFMDFLMHLIQRAGLPLVYTKGFHPKPVVSFNDPLPVGIESYAEYLDLKLSGEIDADVVKKKLQAVECEGVRFLDVIKLPYHSKPVSSVTKTVYYEMSLNRINSCNMSILSSAIELIMSSESFIIKKNSKSSELDVRPFIETIEVDLNGRLLMLVKKINNRIIGPLDILEKGLGIPYNEIIDAPLKKVKVDFEDE
ncbi:MAG: TIGR03960 family B12-binding radical SAM protein [bacterium]